MASNGRLPRSELARVYHPQHVVYLQKDAAAAWNTMFMFVRRTFKVSLYPNGAISAYRTYDQQVYAKRVYGSNAAEPGTSNHGLGLAVDLATRVMRSLIDRCGKHFGWAKVWSDASWEWWHLKWRAGEWSERPDPGWDYENPRLRFKSGGRGQKWAVKKLQRRLRKHGHKKVKVDGNFGKRTVTAVKLFQKRRGIKVDGEVGPMTWAKLRARPKKPKPRKRDKPKPKQRQHKPTVLSETGVRFIAGFEGFRAEPYNDPANHATVGYGHLLHRGPVTAADRKKWGSITKEEGLRLLRNDAAPATRAVLAAVKVPLNQNQLDALVSFTFNVGVGAFQGSTLLRRLNRGEYKAVPSELNRWVKAGSQTLPGLVRRRREEGELFRKVKK